MAVSLKESVRVFKITEKHCDTPVQSANADSKENVVIVQRAIQIDKKSI